MASKKKSKQGKKNDVIAVLLDGVISQLDEVLGGDDKPERLLEPPTWKPAYGLRGDFTESVQTIFSGLDAAECRRLLAADFAPFVDGPALAMALQHLSPGKASRAFDVDMLNELLDQFAIRAVDDMARALLAMALERDAEVPQSCRGLEALLRPRVKEVVELL